MSIEKDEYFLPLNVHICSSFEETNEFYKEGGRLSLFDRPKRPLINEYARSNRMVITGDPGMGKTTVLRQIKSVLDQEGCLTEFIVLKSQNCIVDIEKFCKEKTTRRKVILLDGLDEASAANLTSLQEKIIDISANFESIAIFITSRWNFVKKYPSIATLNYKYLAISPLQRSVVRDRLLSLDIPELDVDSFLDRVISFNHTELVLQTPRYLEYFVKYVKGKDLKSIVSISRNELFEELIYEGLKVEDKNIHAEKRFLVKRMLEKVALVMEIYQINIIKKDDLISILENIQSGITSLFASQVPTEIFFEKSLLLNNVDDETVEFKNTEFQEYLAAKELHRFPDPQRAAFELSIDPVLREIKPTWFNTLSFFVDIDPSTLKPILDFFSLDQAGKVVPHELFDFISKINFFNEISVKVKKEVFISCFNYHQRLNKLLPFRLSMCLASIFEPSEMDMLKCSASATSTDSETTKFLLVNVYSIIEHLFERRSRDVVLDTAFWRKLLLSRVKDSGLDESVKIRALKALSMIGDKSIVNKLPDLSEGDNALSQAFIGCCYELAPNYKRSLYFFIKAIKSNNVYGKIGLAQIKEKKALVMLLRELAIDTVFRHELLKDFTRDDSLEKDILKNIAGIFDSSVGLIVEKLIISALSDSRSFEVSRSIFFAGLFNLLKANDPSLISKLIPKLSKTRDAGIALYVANELFENVLEKNDVKKYVLSMKRLGKEQEAMRTLTAIKLSKRADSEDVYEGGRPFLTAIYSSWEKKRKNNGSFKRARYLDFQKRLRYNKDCFKTDLFEFFNSNTELILEYINNKDKKFFQGIIENLVLKKSDPTKWFFERTDHQITSHPWAFFFGEVLIAAKNLNIDLRPYRSKIINFIPFSDHKYLDLIFTTFPDISHSDLGFVMSVYKDVNSHLRGYHLTNIIELSKRYHLVSVVPLLREFVTEATLDVFTRKNALETAEVLLPDLGFLSAMFSVFEAGSSSDDRTLLLAVNALQVSSHQDTRSILWRMNEVIKSSSPLTLRYGLHDTTDVEREIFGHKTLGTPLQNVSSPEYIDNYLLLLAEGDALWAKSEEYHPYAEYIFQIVQAYFQKLVIHSSYYPIQKLENATIRNPDIAKRSSRFVYLLPDLRRYYLDKLSKPKSIFQAIQSYNLVKDGQLSRVHDVQSLFQELQDAINVDLRRWIEGEGAFELILGEKVFERKLQCYEELVQKVIKAKLESILIKKGLSYIELDRETQTYDGKRVDFLVRYGFVGPIVVELKLATSSDIRGASLEEADSYKSMVRYMAGYGASRGIFLVINNAKTINFERVVEAYQQIDGVMVLKLDCRAKDDSRIKVEK